MLTKARFTRDEWNYLLRLWNITNLSMFSCSHFNNFLSNPTREQSAMSMRGQEVTSGEGSPMAKSKPLIPAKARPINLVVRSESARSERPSQSGECRWRARRSDWLWEAGADEPKPRSNRILSSDATGNTQHADSWKQGERDDSSKSTRSGKPVRAVNTKTDFQNMKITNPKVFQHLQIKLGITTGYSTFAMEAIKANVFLWGSFMSFVNESSHSTSSRLCTESGSIQEHELRGHLEFTQYHTETDVGTFWRYSECAYDWQYTSLVDEIDTVSRIKWFSGQQ